MGDIRTETRVQGPDTIAVPAPTAWPVVLALGVTLMATGLVTSASVSLLGAIFLVSGCVGWFREVLPHEKHESVRIDGRTPSVATSRPQVNQVGWITQEVHRARLPVEIYPISAGIKGGLAGSVVMALLAMLYGVVSGRGVWYASNLLSAGFFPEKMTIAQIAAFHREALIIAAIAHLVCSLLVGILYGAMLPMFPRRPILLGGVIAPVLWSGLLHSVLAALDPVLNQQIDWFWFVMSQIGFGVVAGIVVSRQERVRTRQFLPFAARAGFEASGAMGANREKNGGESHE